MKCAVICFLKYPEPGHVKTRLASTLSNQGAAEFYGLMAERIITEAYPLEQHYDLILYLDPAHEQEKYSSWIGDSWAFRQQQGPDLGARLDHALSQTLEEGYEAVAVIGSDCLGMDERWFQEQVFEPLQQHDLVIGPASDGGYYLLALKQAAPWLFERMPWSTEEVLERTLDRIEMRDLSLLTLDERIDVDDDQDLQNLRANLPDEHFLARKIDHIILSQLKAPELDLEAGDFATGLLEVSMEAQDEDLD